MWFMQDELVLFWKMQEGDWSAFNSFFESYSEQLYLYACRGPGRGGGHRAGHVYLPVGESGENFPFWFSLCLFKLFRQKLLYRS